MLCSRLRRVGLGGRAACRNRSLLGLRPGEEGYAQAPDVAHRGVADAQKSREGPDFSGAGRSIR